GKRKSPTGLWDRRAFPFCASGADALRRRLRRGDHAALGVETVALGIVAEAVLILHGRLVAAATTRRSHLGLLAHIHLLLAHGPLLTHRLLAHRLLRAGTGIGLA